MFSPRRGNHDGVLLSLGIYDTTRVLERLLRIIVTT